MGELRRLHTSWSSRDGLVLMGGFPSAARNQSEIIRSLPARPEPHFQAEEREIFPNDACAISGEESVVLTGGINHKNLAPGESKYRSDVVEYGHGGLLSRLPSLITGRAHHACAAYTQPGGTRVSEEDKTTAITSIFLACVTIIVFTPPTTVTPPTPTTHPESIYLSFSAQV